MAKIKAKVIGYDTPDSGPMVKLQIKEPLKGQKYVVDALSLIHISEPTRPY